MTADTGTITTCGWCKARSHMTSVLEKPLAEHVRLHPGDAWIFDCAFKCDACGRLNICTWSGDHPDDDNVPPRDPSSHTPGLLQWHPNPEISRQFPDVPLHIAEAATEATLCLSMGANRAACALARAVVEATSKERGFASGDLVAKINALKNAGIIRANIADAATEVRHLGNGAAHGDFIEPTTTEEAQEAVGLMELILQEVYQSNALISRRRAARLGGR